MRKELSPTHEAVACEVCGRTILKGERTEEYVVPDGSRRIVCELCTRRAEGAGWIREALHSDVPTAFPRAEPRRSLLARLGLRRPDNGTVQAEPEYDELELEEGLAEPSDVREPSDAALGPDGAEPPGAADARLEEEPELADLRADDPDAGLAPTPEESGWHEAEREAADPEPASQRSAPGPEADDRAGEVEPPRPPTLRSLAREEERRPRRPLRPRRQLRDPRHVRAIPTNAEARVERGLEIFNESEHRRTVAGLVRTLGPPWVTALPVPDSNSEVTVVVAWELSWYQYRVELGDADEPVTLTRKGQEIGELDEELRRWNAAADRGGALAPGAPAR